LLLDEDLNIHPLVKRDLISREYHVIALFLNHLNFEGVFKVKIQLKRILKFEKHFLLLVLGIDFNKTICLILSHPNRDHILITELLNIEVRNLLFEKPLVMGVPGEGLKY
jgi:hypothetical protein